MPAELGNCVAIVAGATRGCGRGIAAALGEAGATVYCTGRSAGGERSPMGRGEIVEDTAALVTQLGGTGIAMRCDHADAAQVEALRDRVLAEHGRVDVLVNSLWGGDRLTQWGTPFWKLDLEQQLELWRGAIETHMVTNRVLVPSMVEANRGLVVELTDGTGFYYRSNLPYDMVKVALIRLAFDMDQELRRHGVTALAVSPGFLRSEAMLDHFDVTEETWRDAIERDRFFAESETPRFVGRCIAALAADPDVMARAGRAWGSWDLAEEYGIDDVDGRRPNFRRFYREHVGVDRFRAPDDGFYAWWDGDVASESGALPSTTT